MRWAGAPSDRGNAGRRPIRRQRCAKPLLPVIPGLDPGTHRRFREDASPLGCRVEPGNDGGEVGRERLESLRARLRAHLLVRLSGPSPARESLHNSRERGFAGFVASNSAVLPGEPEAREGDPWASQFIEKARDPCPLRNVPAGDDGLRSGCRITPSPLHRRPASRARASSCPGRA